MNSFVAKAAQARATIMEQTGMDELDYQLTILESGCRFLEEAVSPLTPDATEHAVLQRYYLADLGFWDYWSHEFAVMELQLYRLWTMPGSVMRWQDAAFKRREFLNEALMMYKSNLIWKGFDLWLKSLEGKDIAFMMPETFVRKSRPSTTH